MDDQLLIDNWTEHGEMENQGQIELWGGRPHTVRLEYYESTGSAVAKFLWSGPGLEKQVIPTQYLFPDLWPESTQGTGLKGVYYTDTKLGGGAEGTLPPGTTAAWGKMAKLGRGFVIWESNRTGSWRIWYRALDGSGLRQVSPEESNRDHFAPHLSPDGTRFVYLSYPKGKDGYQDFTEDASRFVAPLYVINVDGSGRRQVASNGRCYGEDRAAVWLNNEEVIYLAAGRGPTRLNLRSGVEKLASAERALADQPDTDLRIDRRTHFQSLRRGQRNDHGTTLAGGVPALFFGGRSLGLLDGRRRRSHQPHPPRHQRGEPHFGVE